MTFINVIPEKLDVLPEHSDDPGGPWGCNHYPAGRARAMETPFQWGKQLKA